MADHERADAGLAVRPDVEEARRPSARTSTCGSCPCSRRRRGRGGRAAPSRARGRRRPARRRRGRTARRPAARSAGRGRSGSSRGRPGRAGSAAPTRPRTASITSSGPSSGNGTGATTTRAPARAATASTRVPAGVVRVVGGQDLVARVEVEPAEDRVHAGRGVRHEREVVRRGADEGAEGGPGARRGGPRAPGSGTARARVSSRSRRRAWASSTARGQAPKEPWFRKVTAGSSGQSRRAPSGGVTVPIFLCPPGRAQRSAGQTPPPGRRPQPARIPGQSDPQVARGDLSLTPRGAFPRLAARRAVPAVGSSHVR